MNDRLRSLSHEQAACLDRLRASFLASQKLADQVRWLTARGRMHLVREGHLIFHGCVPVDEQAEFLPMAVAGRPYRGRERMATRANNLDSHFCVPLGLVTR